MRRLALLLLLVPAACHAPREGPSADTTEVVLVPPEGVARARADSLARVARDSARTAREDAARRARPGYVVDSALPPEELLARFRAGLPRVDTLSGGAPSRDALVGAIVAALARGDSAALRRMAISAAEYGWLVHPRLPTSRPPYGQPPQLGWQLLASGGATGLARAIAFARREPLRFRGYRCPDSPLSYDGLLAWEHCTVRHATADGRARDVRLFGAIVALGGRYKVLSYANDF